MKPKSSIAWLLNWVLSYFRVIFFEKPYIIVGKDIEPYKLSYMQMITEVNETQDFEKMSKIVTHDVALSYKLLRLINSPFYGRGNKIKSAKQALVMLGSSASKVRKTSTKN